MSPLSRPMGPRRTLHGVPSVVVVDPRFDAYASLAASARLGKITLHLRSSGSEAVKLSRRIPVDAWLIAADLDDMSGDDLVETLRTSTRSSLMAVVVETAEGRRGAIASAEAVASGADAAVSHPITLADLERLLGLPSEERARIFGGDGMSRPFVALPVGVGAAVIAIAILMMG